MSFLILFFYFLGPSRACAGTASSAAPVTTSTTTTTNPVCPTGWQEFNLNCYIFVNQNVTEADAVTACQAIGGTLVSIHSTAENNFVNNLVGQATAWIGVIRTCSQNVNTCFANVDGTAFDYSPPWIAGQPNNAMGQQNCVQINSLGTTNGLWNDLDCTVGFNTSLAPFVCKMPV